MKNSIAFLLLLVFVAGVVHLLKAQTFEKSLYINGGDTLKYRIMFPDNFDKQKQYPLIVFLHGAGERGNDNEKQLVHGRSFFSDQQARENFPAIVVFPQCPQDDYWARIDFSVNEDGTRNFTFRPDLEPTNVMTLLIGLIDKTLSEAWIDKEQVYIGGLSMGGMGTFELLYRKPEIFAAAFPICGGGSVETCHVFARKVPVWVFHGEVDAVVPVDFSVQMVNQIKQEGGDPKLTIYPGVNHNAWDYVFQEKELLPWLFSQKRK